MPFAGDFSDLLNGVIENSDEIKDEEMRELIVRDAKEMLDFLQKIECEEGKV